MAPAVDGRVGLVRAPFLLVGHEQAQEVGMESVAVVECVE